MMQYLKMSVLDEQLLKAMQLFHLFNEKAKELRFFFRLNEGLKKDSAEKKIENHHVSYAFLQSMAYVKNTFLCIE